MNDLLDKIERYKALYWIFNFKIVRVTKLEREQGFSN